LFKQIVQTRNVQKPGIEEGAHPGPVALQDTIIPMVQERFGKWYRADLDDMKSVREVIIQVDT